MSPIHVEINICAEFPIKMLDVLEQLQVEMIAAALEESKGVKTRAAAMLGINRTTFVEKMKRHNFPVNPATTKRK